MYTNQHVIHVSHIAGPWSFACCCSWSELVFELDCFCSCAHSLRPGWSHTLRIRGSRCSRFPTALSLLWCADSKSVSYGFQIPTTRPYTQSRVAQHFRHGILSSRVFVSASSSISERLPSDPYNRQQNAHSLSRAFDYTRLQKRNNTSCTGLTEVV